MCDNNYVVQSEFIVKFSFLSPDGISKSYIGRCKWDFIWSDVGVWWPEARE